MLFEVAIIAKPTKKEAEDGAQERLVFGPKAVIAKTEQAAVVNAVMQAQATQDSKTPALDVNALEVLVRAFR